MSTLVLGPSCSGKSTFIKKAIAEGTGGIANKKVVFGVQLKNSPIEEDIVAHYNILHFTTTAPEKQEGTGLEREEIFRKILANASKFSRVVVLVAPVEELVGRAKNRDMVEDNPATRYNSSFWLEKFNEVNFFKLYERLFDVLDEHSLKYEVVFSSAVNANPFAPSDRVYVHHNLKGLYVEPPLKKDVGELSERSEFHYQSVLLPYGLRTSIGHYGHVRLGRSRSLEPLLSQDLRNKSILDIGSAMGNVLYSAERHGASRLLGIEPNRSRYQAANLLKGVLRSNAEFVQAEFGTAIIEEQFDFVIALNVIHHVREFDYFVTKAAELARDTLILEFPTFEDPKFLKMYRLDHALVEKLNTLPIVGVSSLRAADQTFVYSPKSIVKLLTDRISGFRSLKIYPSPLKGRVIMTFSRL